jgi:hypothetical protein
MALLGLLGSMATAGAGPGGDRARQQVAAEFATARYLTQPGGLATALRDLSVAEQVVGSVNSNPLGRMLVDAALGPAAGNATRRGAPVRRA